VFYFSLLILWGVRQISVFPLGVTARVVFNALVRTQRVFPTPQLAQPYHDVVLSVRLWYCYCNHSCEGSVLL